VRGPGSPGGAGVRSPIIARRRRPPDHPGRGAALPAPHPPRLCARAVDGVRLRSGV